MSIKDELKELARTTLERKYAKQPEHVKTMKKIRNEIEKAIRNEEQKVSVYFEIWGYNEYCPSRLTIVKVMEEIELPYKVAYGNDSYGVTIDLSELYEDEE